MVLAKRRRMAQVPNPQYRGPESAWPHDGRSGRDEIHPCTGLVTGLGAGAGIGSRPIGRPPRWSWKTHPAGGRCGPPAQSSAASAPQGPAPRDPHSGAESGLWGAPAPPTVRHHLKLPSELSRELRMPHARGQQRPSAPPSCARFRAPRSRAGVRTRPGIPSRSAPRRSGAAPPRAHRGRSEGRMDASPRDGNARCRRGVRGSHRRAGASLPRASSGGPGSRSLRSGRPRKPTRSETPWRVVHREAGIGGS